MAKMAHNPSIFMHHLTKMWKIKEKIKGERKNLRKELHERKSQKADLMFFLYSRKRNESRART